MKILQPKEKRKKKKSFICNVFFFWLKFEEISIPEREIAHAAPRSDSICEISIQFEMARSESEQRFARRTLADRERSQSGSSCENVSLNSQNSVFVEKLVFIIKKKFEEKKLKSKNLKKKIPKRKAFLHFPWHICEKSEKLHLPPTTARSIQFRFFDEHFATRSETKEEGENLIDDKEKDFHFLRFQIALKLFNSSRNLF